jgi:hypothetical protein
MLDGDSLIRVVFVTLVWVLYPPPANFDVKILYVLNQTMAYAASVLTHLDCFWLRFLHFL